MEECEYRFVCPIQGCSRKKDLSCIGALLTQIEQEREQRKKTEDVAVEWTEAEASDIFFRCDHRACALCDSEKSGCDHTTDIRHAASFRMVERNFLEI